MSPNNLRHERLNDNHPRLFDEWWPALLPVIYQLSHSLVGHEDADDVCQLVALRAFQSKKTFRDIEHARAWTLAVAKNACRDIFRRRKRSRELSLDDDAWSDTPSARAALAQRTPRDPEAALLTKETDALLRATVHMLPPRLRDAATLHFFEEQPHENVAATLRITEANARKRIQNARSFLRRERHSGFATASRTRRDRQRDALFTTPKVHALLVEQINGEETDAEILLRTRSDTRSLEQMRGFCGRGDAGTQRELAHALVERGHLEEAVSVYRRVIDAGGLDPLPCIELASIQRALGDHAGAAATLLNGADEVSRAADREHLLVLAHRAAGDDHTALERATRLVCETGATAEHWRLLAEILLAAGRPCGAEVAAEHALRLNPADPLAPGFLYDARVEQAKFRGAIAAVLATPFIPSIQRLLYGRLRARHLEDAKLLLRRLPTARAATQAAAAFIAIASGRLAEAERIAAGFADQHPHHAGARHAYADVLIALGKNDEALRVLESLSPTAEVLRTEARIVGGARDARSRRLVDNVQRRFASHAALLDSAGMVLFADGDVCAASEFLRRALDIEPQWPRLRRHLARIVAVAESPIVAAAELEPWWHKDEHSAFAALQMAAWTAQCGADFVRRWAETALERSDALAFSDPANAFYCRGEALRRLDRPADAVVAFCAALECHLPHPARRRAEAAILDILTSTSHSQKGEA